MAARRYGRCVSSRARSAIGAPPSLGDAALAGGAFVFTLSGAALLGARSDEPDLAPLAVVVLVAQCAPLVWRRRHPVVVWAITGLAGVLYGLAEWPDPLVAVGSLIALATVFECCSRRTAALVWCTSAAAATVGLVLPGDSDALDVWMAVVALGLAPLVGDRQRVRNAFTAQTEEAARLRQEEHHREIREARDAERRHLARELHDVVAHHVSMMVVQAEAGASACEGTAASTALDELATTGRRTLGELRTMLEVMADGQQAAPTAPQPGVTEIPELVDGVRRRGLSVELEVTGVQRDVPPAVSLSAFRIVQEGLTNVMKHARSARARVGLRFEPTALEITVADDGRSGPRPAGRTREPVTSPGSGHGLHGIRERVELLHGHFEASPRREGGFELRAVLPTGSAP